MNALEQFKRKAGIPAGFGAEQPYAHLAYVDESKAVGADADVEFDGEAGRVTVTVTEWMKAETGTDRTPATRFEFDLATGGIIGGDDDALINLLVMIDGMRVLGDEEGA